MTQDEKPRQFPQEPEKLAASLPDRVRQLQYGEITIAVHQGQVVEVKTTQRER